MKCARMRVLGPGGADAWALYEQGEFGYKWRDSRFGLHVSM